MKEQIIVIRKEIEELNEKVKQKWKEISVLENQCKHNWIEPKCVTYKVEYGESHFGGSYDYHQWERECNNCGKKETTTREAYLKVPNFD